MTIGYGVRKNQSEYESDDWNQVKGIRDSCFPNMRRFLASLAIMRIEEENLKKELQNEQNVKKELQNEENAKNETQDLKLTYITKNPQTITQPEQIEKYDANFPTISQSLIRHELKGWTTVGKQEKKTTFENVPKKVADVAKSKTAMCNSFFSGEKCRHGKHCRYAHSAEELVVSECTYGETCKCVHYSGGYCCNNKGKVCARKHPNESDEDFFIRTGLKKREPPTEEEMQRTYEEFLRVSEKVKDKQVKNVKKQVWKVYENVQFKPKPVIVTKPVKLAEIDFEAQKIRDKNDITSRIKELNINIKRASETASRFKAIRDATEYYKLQVVKLVDKIKNYKTEIASLEGRIVEVENRKKPVNKPEIVFENITLPVSPISKVSDKPRVEKVVTVVLFVPQNTKVSVVENGWVEVKNKQRKPVEVCKPVEAVEKPVTPIDDRNHAFSVLKNKEMMDKVLVKTEMCRFGKSCKRGGACRFAHDKSELTAKLCLFGSCCKCVIETKNGLMNKYGEKKCTFKHPSETVDSFHKRIGL